jgi:hypothetical protein
MERTRQSALPSLERACSGCEEESRGSRALVACKAEPEETGIAENPAAAPYP